MRRRLCHSVFGLSLALLWSGLLTGCAENPQYPIIQPVRSPDPMIEGLSSRGSLRRDMGRAPIEIEQRKIARENLPAPVPAPLGHGTVRNLVPPAMPVPVPASGSRDSGTRDIVPKQKMAQMKAESLPEAVPAMPNPMVAVLQRAVNGENTATSAPVPVPVMPAPVMPLPVKNAPIIATVRPEDRLKTAKIPAAGEAGLKRPAVVATVSEPKPKAKVEPEMDNAATGKALLQMLDAPPAKAAVTPPTLKAPVISHEKPMAKPVAKPVAPLLAPVQAKAPAVSTSQDPEIVMEPGAGAMGVSASIPEPVSEPIPQTKTPEETPVSALVNRLVPEKPEPEKPEMVKPPVSVEKPLQAETLSSLYAGMRPLQAPEARIAAEIPAEPLLRVETAPVKAPESTARETASSKFLTGSVLAETENGTPSVPQPDSGTHTRHMSPLMGGQSLKAPILNTGSLDTETLKSPPLPASNKVIAANYGVGTVVIGGETESVKVFAPDDQARSALMPESVPIVMGYAGFKALAADGISPEDARLIEKIAADVKQHGGVLRIVGRAALENGKSGIEAESASLALATRRAQFVANRLIGNGIPEGDITVLATGGVKGSTQQTERADIFMIRR